MGKPTADIPLILRVESSAGRCRLEVTPKTTLVELKKRVADHFNTSPETVLIRRENKEVLDGDKRSMRRLGMQNGEVLRVESVSSTDMRGPQTNMTMLGQSTGTRPKLSTSDLVPDPSAASNSTSSGKGGESQEGKKKGPAFKSFDAYLRERGYATAELPLNLSFKPGLIDKGRMTKLPPSVTLKHQLYRHVDHIEFMNIEEINNFVSYWRFDLDMCKQRCGYLYGYYVEDLHYPEGIRAVLEAIYEPPQNSQVDSVAPQEDDFRTAVNRIAAALSLECIGFIYTHLPRGKIHMSAEECMQQARLQNQYMTDKHYTGYKHSTFVTVTVAADEGMKGEPTPNALMVSDLGMALIRDGNVEENQDLPQRIRLRRPLRHEVLPEILESGKSVINGDNTFDVDWLLVRVNDSAPKKVCSRFQSTRFPRENRENNPVVPADIKRFMREIEDKTGSSATTRELCDFHFLLCVAKIFDVETVLTICDAINCNAPLEPAMLEILRSIS